MHDVAESLLEKPLLEQWYRDLYRTLGGLIRNLVGRGLNKRTLEALGVGIDEFPELPLFPFHFKFLSAI